MKPFHKNLAHVCEYDRTARSGAISFENDNFLYKNRSNQRPNFGQLLLQQGLDSGMYFGQAPTRSAPYFIGMPEGSDGNIIVVGGNGSGKSRYIAMPTLSTWHGAICATDIKGELSNHYAQLFRQGCVTRPHIIFDPTEPGSPSYDPFWWLLSDDESNLLSNIWDIVRSIIPLSPEDKQPFWVETEQGVFAAALLYYFQCGLSFSESVSMIVSESISALTSTLRASSDLRIQALLGEISEMKAETVAAVDRGLRNKLMLFAVDPQISHALRGKRESAPCFTWEDLQKYQIFLRIPAHKVEQWSGAINLMYAQLFRYLERRPERYTPESAAHPQLLLLMDEFARFGKLDNMTAALSTLRSKKVNICLFVQSIAQLDKFYGSEDRRIIFDNCQYQAILRANDPQTQECLSKLIGTTIQRQHGISKQLDRDMSKSGFGLQISETRDWVIQPHELATLHDVLLLTPSGFFAVEKSGSPIGSYQDILTKIVHDDPDNIALEKLILHNNIQIHKEGNEEYIMCTMKERQKNASERAKQFEQQQRKTQRQTKAAQKKKDERRKFIVGELVIQYFPKLLEIDPGTTQEETQKRFQNFAVFLEVLSNSPYLHELQERAAQLVTTNV